MILLYAFLLSKEIILKYELLTCIVYQSMCHMSHSYNLYMIYYKNIHKMHINKEIYGKKMHHLCTIETLKDQ